MSKYRKISAEKIRNGLFLAASRSYAEQFIEPFIRAKYKLNEPKNNENDGTDSKGRRYEIKACKVLKSTGNVKKTIPIIERILFESNNIVTSRLVLFKDFSTLRYLGNVQNVKRDHFDFLIYVLLFQDCIKIFLAKQEEIKTGDFPNWSEKHGRFDALGKSGQFPVTSKNMKWHLDNHLKDTVTYEELKNTYIGLSK